MRFLGYEVLEAADAEAALDLLHRAPDIVLTDLHLPKMQGDELALKVKARLPQTRIAFASGASQASSVADAILAKPYDAQQLEALLERLA
jgi:CheY-like chemotaxis protein